MFDALAAPTGLTRAKSTFDRRDVIQALCERWPADGAVDARAFEAAADRFLSSGRAVALLPDDESFRRRDGRLLPLAREQLRYSTPELLAREQHLIERATSAAGAGVGVAKPKAVRQAIKARPTLSDEQRRMVERLCLDGDLSRSWRARRVPARRSRSAPRARRGRPRAIRCSGSRSRDAPPVSCSTGAGIASTSTAALLGDLARGTTGCRPASYSWSTRPAMVSTRQLAALLEHVEQAGGKLVLSGDHRQLPELGAGGAFRGLVRRGHAIELTENQRQVERWERTALDHVSAGRAEPALALYAANDRIRIGETSEADPQPARQRLVGRSTPARATRDDRPPPRATSPTSTPARAASCAPPARFTAASCGYQEVTSPRATRS